jgi:tetratricopeptide (TPR) repeat protein
MPVDDERFLRLVTDNIDSQHLPANEADAALVELATKIRRHDFTDIKESDATKAFGLYCRACDQMYDMLTADDEKEVAHLLEEAVKLDPHCYDARCLLATREPDTQKRVAALRDMKREAWLYCSSQVSPEDYMDIEGQPQAWQCWQMRPYMRLVQTLALLYFDLGKNSLAIQEYESLMHLNSADDQGVRMQLIMLYVTLERFGDAQRLFDQFNGERNCWFLLAMSIARYKQDDLDGASDFLEQLLAYCPDALPVMIDAKVPQFYGMDYVPGSQEEMELAMEDADYLLMGTPEYLDWVARVQDTVWKRAATARSKKHRSWH